MKKGELLELVNNMDDNEEVLDVLKAHKEIEGLIKSSEFNVETLTTDDYKNILEKNKAIAGYNKAEIDRAISKAVENFKEKKMPKYIEEGIKAKSTEGLTEEQKQLRALQEKIEQMEQEKAQAELLNSNRSKLKEAKLSEDLAKYIQSDEDIDFFKTLITNSVNEGVKEKINNSNYVPPQSDGVNIGFADGVEQQFFNKTGLKL